MPDNTETNDSQDDTGDETLINQTASSVGRNLNALTPTRILALFVFVGTIYIGVVLGQVDVPLNQALFGFALFVVAAAHMYSRETGSDVDLVVAAWTVLGGVLVGVEFGFLSIPFGENWTGLIVVVLIVADGYIIDRKRSR